MPRLSILGLALAAWLVLAPPGGAAPLPAPPGATAGAVSGALGEDCNGNGVPDGADIAQGTSQDCNGNNVPDECDIDDGTSEDCNDNGIPDECDLAGGASLDCNANGVPDECEPDCNGNGIPDDCDVSQGISQDCNGNGNPDECDLSSGASLDCNGNGIPDECEPDCNGSGFPDDCDLAQGTSLDCNANGVPDECDLAAGTSQDCNGNGVPDECDVAGGQSADCNTNGVPDECEADCNANGVPDDCDVSQGTSQDCNANGVPDECDLAGGQSVDCNANGVPDECEADCNANGIPDDCDISQGTSQDCNANGVPDECEVDCNGNGIPDDCDLSIGTSQDCNANGVPDECDIAGGQSADCNANGVPDECEGDCNANGVPDDCDLAAGTSQDCNANGVPDECDVAGGQSADCNANDVPDECEEDCNANGVPDDCDVSQGTSQDCNANGVPDECEGDCNANGIPDDCDIGAGTSEDCNGNGAPDECDVAGGQSADCNANGVPDECEADCNANGVPDDCDVSQGTSQDCNGNGVPDECEEDCNGNGTPDECDLATGTSEDCNANGIPDECDVAGGQSADCNANGIPDECDVAGGQSADCNTNGVPDECEADCNANGVPDDCDLSGGTSLDCNGNGVPDECDLSGGQSADCNGNAVPDECDIATGSSADCNANGVPDDCDLSGGTSQDGNGNGIPDECEMLRNVVIFFVDDVGPDQLAMYDEINPYEGAADPFADHLYVDAPNLQELANTGVTFLNAYATPVCSASRASLLTGRYQSALGVGAAVRHDHVGAYPGGLAEFGDPGFEAPTLADLAQSAGYEAGIVGKWHLGLPTPEMDPLNGDPAWLGWSNIPLRGHWTEYRCTFRNLDTHPFPDNGLDPGYYSFFWNRNGDIEAVTNQYATVVQLDEALDYCSTTQEPFVCYVSTNACHTPWDELPPAELVNTPEYLAGQPTAFKNYAATLEAFDTKLGHFLDGLPPTIRDRTLIVVMGDNGTDATVLRSARDDDGLDLGPTYDFLLDDPVPLGRFKRSVYERGIRIPLIVSGPGVAQPGRTTRALVDVVDAFPTIAEVMGVDPGTVDGTSFLPVVEDESVDLAAHARQFTHSDYFEDNGQIDLAAEDRRTGFSLRLADGRRFKIVRRFDFVNAGVFDEFYLLQDALGDDVDPYELSPLSIQPGDEYYDEYLEVAQALSPSEQYNYCTANPNSTGSPAIMSTQGSASVAANDLVLVAEVVPPGQFGIFFYGPEEVLFPFGNGFRCVGAGAVPTQRLPTTISDAAGVLSWALDYTDPPTMSGTILPGSTWKFQAWYRDPPAGGAGFDLSDGLSITFAP